MALHLRLGFMGILSHQDIAPLALSAANQASDRLINSFQPLSSNMDASQEAQPKSRMNIASSSGRINRTTLSGCYADQ